MPTARDEWRPNRVSIMSGNTEWQERASSVLGQGTFQHRLAPFIQAGRNGTLIVDIDGNEYVDCLSAWGAEPYGPAHPHVLNAANDAWQRYGTQISMAVLHPEAVTLAERLVELAPPSITRAEFSVTGTLAVESAVRIMRQVTGRPFILVFGPVYHGNSTSLSASMSSDANTVGTGAAAFNTGIIHVPYPDTAESPFRDGTVGNAADVLHYLRNWVLQYQIDPSQVAGVIIEPITTEGGVSAPSQEFWNGLQALCREHDWILTVDEVQTGMGRCGTVYCVDRWGVDPDLILLGKGLSAGGPAIAAILGSERTLGNTELTLGSTFGWQPAACAAANAGLDILTDENTLPHVQHLEEIANRLLLPLTGLSHVTRIRAHGATVAVTYRVPNPVDNTGRDGEYTSRIHSRLLSEGVLGIGESDKNYYRFQPSLLIPDEQWEYALSRLAAAVADPALLSP